MKKNILLMLFVSMILCSCSDSKFYDKYDFDFGVIKNYSPYIIADTKNISQDDYFVFHGRYYKEEGIDATFFDFSASGFELTFTGTSLEGSFLCTNAGDNKNRPYLAVAIDNDYDPDHMTPIVLTSGVNSNCTGNEGKYTKHEHVLLAHNLENTKHTIRVFKRSEANNSKVGIKSVSTDGIINIIEPKQYNYKMEVYGDSVTCGYAVESNDYYENFSTRTENAMKSYAFIAANKINADVSLISCGGYPIYKSKYSENCSPSTIPDMLSLATSNWGNVPLVNWDNNNFIPDIVVIAMGANDGSILETYTPGTEQYNSFVSSMKSSYKTFIDNILIKYPLTQIIVSSEILNLGEFFENFWDEIVSEYNLDHTTLTKPIIRAKYDAFNISENRNLPGAGHPNSEMQKIAGEELADIINSL